MQRRKARPDSFKKDAVRRLIARGSKTVTEIAKELGASPSIRQGRRLQSPIVAVASSHQHQTVCQVDPDA